MKYFYEKTTQVLFTVNDGFTKLNNYQPRFHPFQARVQYRGKTFEASCVPYKNLNGQAGKNFRHPQGESERKGLNTTSGVQFAALPLVKAVV